MTTRKDLDYHFNMRKEMPLSWGLSGMISEIGFLGRPLPASRCLTPVRVEIDGERLYYGRGEGLEVERLILRRISPPSELLDRFVSLSNGSASAVKKFASKYGVLGICEHGLPCTHQSCVPINSGWSCMPMGWGRGDMANSPTHDPWEPLSSWFSYSARARALLNIAARLHQGKCGLVNDWQQIHGTTPSQSLDNPSNDNEKRLLIEKWILTGELNHWLSVGGVRPLIEWGLGKGSTQPRIVLSSGRLPFGLFGAIGLQLLSAVARSDGLDVCCGCGTAYMPGRRPNPNRRSYCPNCRKRKVPQRDASRAYYQRIKSKGGRHAS